MANSIFISNDKDFTSVVEIEVDIYNMMENVNDIITQMENSSDKVATAIHYNEEFNASILWLNEVKGIHGENLLTKVQLIFNDNH